MIRVLPAEAPRSWPRSKRSTPRTRAPRNAQRAATALPIPPRPATTTSNGAIAPGLRVGPSAIHGKGCFAAVPFARRRKIAEYTGEKITNAEAERRGRRRRILRISGLDERWSIDGSRGGNGTHYINHSCRPNAFMQTIGGHLLVLALRDIRPGEEITVDYVETLHSDRKRCTCGAATCRGTINRRSRATSPGSGSAG